MEEKEKEKNEKKKQGLGDTIRNNLMNQNRTISISFPFDVYSELKKYAKIKTGNCYWLAIKDLLNQSRYYSFLSETIQVLIQNNNMLMGKLIEIEDKVNGLINSPVKKKEFKTWGKPEEKEEKKDEEKN